MAPIRALAVPSISWKASPTTVDCAGPSDSAFNAWYAPNFDATGWTAVSLPIAGGLPSPGDRFYRGTFTVDGRAQATISFDSDDGIWVYVNGSFKGHWGGACHTGGCVGHPGGCGSANVYVDISADLVQGTNVLAFQVSNAGGGSYGNLYFTAFQNTSQPLDLLRPDADGFCRPTCLFDWAPATPPVAKYVLSVDNGVTKDDIPPSPTEYALTVTEQLSEGLHFWSVQACDAQDNCVQSPNTFTVKIDGTPPVSFALQSPADNDWRSRNNPFALQWAPTSDGASATPSGLDHYDVLIDGQVRVTAPAAASSVASTMTPIYASLGDGSHTWDVVAVDAVGNSTTAATRTIRMDSTYPVFAPFTPIPADFTYTTNTTPTVQWQTASDAGGSGVVSQRVVLDNVTEFDPGLEATSFMFPMPLADALHQWRVRATDAAGNVTYTNAFRFGVDTTGPTGLRLDAAAGTPDGAVVSSLTPTLCWKSASDGGSGMAGYRLYLNGVLARNGISAASTCTTPTQGLVDGSYQWLIEAYDQLGNISRSLETFTFTVETQAPEAFVLVAPGDGTTLSEARPAFSWTASLDKGVGLDRYVVSIDNGGGGICPTPCVVPAGQTSFIPAHDLGVGPHSWFVTAYDKAGKSTQAAPFSFDVLATPTPTETATGTHSATTTPSATATATGTYTGTRTFTATLPPTVTLTPSGTATITATPTAIPTFTATPAPTATYTASTTATLTASPTATSPTPTDTAAATSTPTRTPLATLTATPTQSATVSFTPTVTPLPTADTCPGDCDHSGQVTVSDLVTLVNIALGHASLSRCMSGDANADGMVTIGEIIRTVNRALQGCVP